MVTSIHYNPVNDKNQSKILGSRKYNLEYDSIGTLSFENWLESFEVKHYPRF